MCVCVCVCIGMHLSMYVCVYTAALIRTSADLPCSVGTAAPHVCGLLPKQTEV